MSHAVSAERCWSFSLAYRSRHELPLPHEGNERERKKVVFQWLSIEFPLLPLPLPGHGDRDLPRFALRLNLHWDFGCWDKWARPSERVLQVRIQPEADDTGIQVDKFVNLPFRQRSQVGEHRICHRAVNGSNPTGHNFFPYFNMDEKCATDGARTADRRIGSQ